ncbi:aryl hydrocarbon receptor-like [Anguilla anguilla]|uniref:aryl hydrocarbon receptor-like n=1 Tax=Anguilla anguilla TaxID=7936 RepID=UPI0015AA18B6|nr:aryl hydrocarbon receptor-like [Anguilla anguilla]
MSGNAGIYAVKKRKKPVQKMPKPPPPEGIKSNPSKRHRDRLNGELDRLTGLLPFSQDVRSRLDKLSVLRLSVGYLKVKSFFGATMKKGGGGWPEDRTAIFGGNGHSVTTLDGVSFSEGDLLLQALNGFVLVVTAEGYIFYASATIQDYLGFHQSDVVHQSVFELIHTDDRAMFRRQLHFAFNPNQSSSEQDGDEESGMQSSSDITSNIVNYDPQHIPPENSSFLERSFCCRFRCLLDNSSGFLALNFQGRLKYLHGLNKVSEDGNVAHPQLALFVIAMPVQPPSILEIRAKTLIFQTKHKLDFSPMGIDTRGKVVLGYTELELCTRGSGYQFIHAADMMYCAENHIKMIKTGESGFTVFRLLTKPGVWVWVQANARLVFKGGRPDFIIARQRPLTNEEGEEHLRQRRMQLPFNFATGEAVLYENSPTLDLPNISANGKASQVKNVPGQKGLDPNSILGCMLQQDKSVYAQLPEPDPQATLDSAFMDSRALVNIPGDPWQQEAPKPSCAIKEEASVMAMMDTLQEIMSGGSLQDLEVDPAELEQWEDALLRMNIGDGDASEEFADILNNEVFSYVEGILFKENGVGGSLGPVPANGFPANPRGNQDSFVGMPESLPVNALQNPILPANQSFTHPNALLASSQNQPIAANLQADYLGMGGLSHQVAGDAARGFQQLPSMNDPMQDSMGLSAGSDSMPVLPPFQHAQQGGMFTQSTGLPVPTSKTFLSENNQSPHNTTLPGPRAQMHNQVSQRLPGSKTLFSPSSLNGFGHLPQTQIQMSAQGTAGQVQPNPMASLKARLTAHQSTVQLQNSVSQSNHMASAQENGWVPSIPNANFADNLLEAFTPNSLAPQDFLLEPDPGACLQGHLSLQTQNNQRLQSWQHQQQLPATLPNGHQHPSSCFSQTPGFPRNPLTAILAQNSENYSAGYGPQNGGVYPPQAAVADNTPLSGNSCMFESSSSPGMQFSGVGLAGSLSSCQNRNLTHGQSYPQASCYFPRNPGEPVMGSSAGPAYASLSGKTAPGFSPENLLASQQYLSYSGQAQMPSCLLEENGSPSIPLSVPPLTNGTAFYTENNQSRCCDF